MRKNTARHWLHAGLDLLPLILIPVFMIYSHRHTIDSGSIEVPVDKVVDFNQEFNYNELHEWFNNGVSNLNYSTNLLTFDNSSGIHSVYTNFDFDDNDIYYLSALAKGTNSPQVHFGWHTNYSAVTYTLTNAYQKISCLSDTTTNSSLYLYVYCYGDTTSVDISYINLINLTKMFGAGNEPTLAQFNEWYSDDYYEYTLSSKQLLKGYSTLTYDDTDIMSQFTYQLYNSIDKYFNMGNVFGMSNVYDWFNLNIFGGNASISIYIVWNIVLYEFVMDLLFLLYALFMWFIDVTKRLIEKPLDSIK